MISRLLVSRPTCSYLIIRTLKNGTGIYKMKSEEEKADEIVCAFDESGKGAVLGPQIVAAITMKVSFNEDVYFNDIFQ